MLYDLKKEIDRSKFKKRANELFLEGCVVELTKKEQRTLKQNSYLHLILTWFAIESGYTVFFVKREYFKILVNPEIFIRETKCKFTGKIIQSLRSTSDLSTEEITVCINRFRTWSSQEANIYLPEPDERKFLQEIELEAQRHKEYL